VIPTSTEAERWAQARAVATRWRTRASNHRVPLWARIAAYAESKAGLDGHAPLSQGELRRVIDPSIPMSSYSRAINYLVKAQWLDSSSSARCLVQHGAGHSTTCPATHRGEGR
jgi:hypothetical protein